MNSARRCGAAYRGKVLDLLQLERLVSTQPQYIERWHVWSSLFRYVVAAMDGGCVAANYTATAARVRGLPTAAARQAAAKGSLLPIRVELVAAARNITWVRSPPPMTVCA